MESTNFNQSFKGGLFHRLEANSEPELTAGEGALGRRNSTLESGA